MLTWATLLDGTNTYSSYIGGTTNALSDIVDASFLPFWYIKVLEYLGELATFSVTVLFSSGFLLLGFFAVWWWIFVPALRVLSRNYR